VIDDFKAQDPGWRNGGRDGLWWPKWVVVIGMGRGDRDGPNTHNDLQACVIIDLCTIFNAAIKRDIIIS